MPTIVNINIVPPKIELNKLPTFSIQDYGNILSTEEKINVNRGAKGFSVIYDSDTFIALDTPVFAYSIMKILTGNLPNAKKFQFIFQYHYVDIDNPEEIAYELSKKIDHMLVFFTKLSRDGKIDIIEEPIFLNKEIENEEEMDDYLDDEDDDEDEDDEEEDFDPTDPYGIFGHIEERSRERKPKRYYGTSHVWRNTKNPKRAIKRHGLIVAYDKDDLKKDEKIIREFLKDFLPGKGQWKRKFREEILERWLKYFAISKKELEKKEKKHRKEMKKEKETSKQKKQPKMNPIWNIANRIPSAPINRWNDINK